MARRKRKSGGLIQDLFELLFELPWWGALLLGAVFIVAAALNPAPASYILFGISMVSFLAALVNCMRVMDRLTLFSSANDIESIRAMSWREFETLVGEAYRRQGYEVEETGGGGADGGIDLILHGKSQKTIVQCKQWKTYKVGVKIVREMYGIMTAERADRVIIVASRTYTQEALAFARGKPIELLDGNALVRLIGEVKRPPAATKTPAPPDPAPPPVTVAPQTTLRVHAHACPRCGSTMVRRIAKKGINAGNPFWGCTRYPACKGIVNVW